jgi:hypothetical protein
MQVARKHKTIELGKTVISINPRIRGTPLPSFSFHFPLELWIINNRHEQVNDKHTPYLFPQNHHITKAAGTTAFDFGILSLYSLVNMYFFLVCSLATIIILKWLCIVFFFF